MRVLAAVNVILSPTREIRAHSECCEIHNAMPYEATHRRCGWAASLQGGRTGIRKMPRKEEDDA